LARKIRKGDRDLQPDKHEKLRRRVVDAAEAALARKQNVSAVDILTGAASSNAAIAMIRALSMFSLRNELDSD
jgi:hypothetical protein